jgi:hypothetical protein
MRVSAQGSSVSESYPAVYLGFGAGAKAFDRMAAAGRAALLRTRSTGKRLRLRRRGPMR